MNKKLLLLEAKYLSKSYDSLNNVLENVNIKLYQSQVIAITGASGSGKSTLLHILGLLDKFDSGGIVINNQEINTDSSIDCTKIRSENIGFIYQDHYLIYDLNVIENVELPLLISGKSSDFARKRASYLLEKFGLLQKQFSFPQKLSGGEQQRVSVARAIANHPKIILADEPTGNLDHKNAENVFDFFLEISREEGMGCIIVTHNLNLASRCDLNMEIKNSGLYII